MNHLDDEQSYGIHTSLLLGSLRCSPTPRCSYTPDLPPYGNSRLQRILPEFHWCHLCSIPPSGRASGIRSHSSLYGSSIAGCQCCSIRYTTCCSSRNCPVVDDHWFCHCTPRPHPTTSNSLGIGYVRIVGNCSVLVPVGCRRLFVLDGILHAPYGVIQHHRCFIQLMHYSFYRDPDHNQTLQMFHIFRWNLR